MAADSALSGVEEGLAVVVRVTVRRLDVVDDDSEETAIELLV